MLFLLIAGGINTSIFGLRIRSNDWSDPALAAIASLLALAWMRRSTERASVGARVTGWLRRPDNLVIAAILAVAAIARFWALTFGLPHPAARPDEEAVASLAGSYLQGNFAPSSFTYPPLFILVVAAVMWLVFWQMPSTLRRLRIPVVPGDPSTATSRTLQRVLSATAGIASVWVLYRIGVKLFDRTTALVAAAFFALAFLHVRDSHFGVTDVPMVFMVLAAFLAIANLAQSGSHRDLTSAGILTGLAVATKYNAALLVLPACFALLDDPRHRSPAMRLGRIVAFGGIAAAAFLIVCPYALFDYPTFVNDVIEVSRHLARGHGPDLGRGWSYHLTTTLRHGLGLPLLLAGILGLILLIYRTGRTGVLVGLFPLAYYAVSGSGRTVFARHALPTVPFLCLTAAYLVTTIGEAMSSALRRPRWRTAVVATMAALVVWPSAMSVIAFNRLIGREDSRVLARRWIDAHFPAGTTILQLGQTNGHAFIYYEPEYVLSEIPSAARPTLVILVSSPLASQDLDHTAPWVKHEYDLQFAQQVVDENDSRNVYDRQDEFFVPLAGFHRVERPGPNLRVYVRRAESATRGANESTRR